MTKDYSDTDKEIKTAMTDLIKAWPTPIPPEQPVKSPDEVAKLVKNIQEKAQIVSKG